MINQVEPMSFEERDLLKLKKQKKIEKKKVFSNETAKELRKAPKKGKKAKPSSRFTDYDSEEWYD
ncbi:MULTISPECIES: hypothetical protein [unclassified Fusibacter]|uniref:hypothetical protein n=1 Tax=unclassified Fusibacter TaxID=2624464 RepID=UPI0010106E43|nr:MULTISPECIES: hypothetical protein [unclassified Fusibacter]MCK8060030.1 hypothetical protein [Fusibacter sp. A2]NPE22170.1 hypothetical protein [Fusibacter sp. A1]RXV60946.1 hypothetical protein DWB64_10015 [Fusibacter sp. A1]